MNGEETKMSKNTAKERFIRRRKQKVQEGKNDALTGKKPSELTKAYLKGYEEGMACKAKIIEQEWND